MTTDKLAAIASSVTVCVAVLAGLWIAGSPAEQRLVRADQQRLGDLQRLSGALQAYHSEHRRLPERLEALVDGRTLAAMPLDPIIGTLYDYRPTAPDAYALCAEFDRASSNESPGDFWHHGAGRYCFSFDLDLD